ncbi:uncharacterized protein LOC112164042 [Rosa chinensis]|uniref:uncharacterized protein LOC112164042 n=1 Tax=Rosa chinensis TaxID=74649 RepID=UPI000D09176C|nr:uncharacterized protein LOC112164042 [Rosa chinensis]
MENEAKKFLELSEQESETVSGLALPEFRLGEATIYDHLALRGIRVDRVEPGLVVCTFKVPLRLLDRDGNFASGAIANLVDVVGSCVVYVSGAPMNVTMEVSISYLSTAKLDDELEITSRLLGVRTKRRLLWNNSSSKKQGNRKDYFRGSTFLVSFSYTWLNRCYGDIDYFFSFSFFDMVSSGGA